VEVLKGRAVVVFASDIMEEEGEMDSKPARGSTREEIEIRVVEVGVGVDVDVNLVEQEEEVGGEMHLRHEEWSE